jgi:uncharacterized membrane protein
LLFAMLEKNTKSKNTFESSLKEIEQESMKEVMVRVRHATRKVLRGLFELTIYAVIGYFVLTNLINGILWPLLLFIVVGVLLLIFGLQWQAEMKDKLNKLPKKEK